MGRAGSPRGQPASQPAGHCGGQISARRLRVVVGELNLFVRKLAKVQAAAPANLAASCTADNAHKSAPHSRESGPSRRAANWRPKGTENSGRPNHLTGGRPAGQRATLGRVSFALSRPAGQLGGAIAVAGRRATCLMRATSLKLISLHWRAASLSRGPSRATRAKRPGRPGGGRATIDRLAEAAAAAAAAAAEGKVEAEGGVAAQRLLGGRAPSRSARSTGRIFVKTAGPNANHSITIGRERASGRTRRAPLHTRTNGFWRAISSGQGRPAPSWLAGRPAQS